MRRMSSAPAAAPESALSRLLEVESRLEAMLEEARRDADMILRDARLRADARAGAMNAEIAAADTALSATLASEAAARITEEEEALARIRARYEAVDERGLESLAAWVVEQVLAAAAGTEAP
jgi:hypothetical protein